MKKHLHIIRINTLGLKHARIDNDMDYYEYYSTIYYAFKNNTEVSLIVPDVTISVDSCSMCLYSSFFFGLILTSFLSP